MGQLSEKVRTRWRALIAEQQASGQSMAAFCRERGLREGPFYEWKKRLQRPEVSPFVAVEIAPIETPATPLPLPVALTSSMLIEIRLRYGRTLLVGPGFESSHLLRVLRVLEQEP